MFKKVLIVLVLAIVVFFGIAAMQPAEFSISRSTTVNAAPAKVFSQVNDFHKWENWSPWAKMDPSMKTTYEGPASGAGASYSWAGNSKVGEGKMSITQVKPSEQVLIQLDFLKPFKASNLTTFDFKAESKTTVVTWTMSGKNNLFAKAMHMVMNMDKMIGPDFEKGLAQMKAEAEKK